MKKIIAFCVSLLFISGNICIDVNAEAINETTTTYNAIVYSTGLISNYGISISKSGNTIYFSGKTECFNTMKSVGFVNITLQRSSDGVKWSNYLTINDILDSSVHNRTIANKSLGTVPSGYKYRLTCTHYAKETGLFGKSESIGNISNIV